MAPHFASPKCSVAMVVYDHRAAALRRALKHERQEEEAEAEADASASSSSSRAGKRARQQQQEDSASIVLDVKPINAVAPRPPPPAVLDVKPINGVPPPPPPAARQLQLPPPPPAGRELPACLREHFLPALGLRADLPVHFIAEKVVTPTDVDGHQNRFRIPIGGVDRCLRAILTPAELDAANLLRDTAPRPRHKPTKKPADQEAEEMREPRKQGKAHGGLRVRLADLAAGASRDLRVARWDSSRATVVKGEGYLDFVRRCSFGEGDAVEIWAFVQRPVRVFGVDVQRGDAVLHVLIVNKHRPPQRCCYCPIFARAVNPSTSVAGS